MHVRVRRLPRGERVFNAAIEARWPPRTGNNISGTVKLVAYGNLVIWIRFFVCVCVCVCVCEKERALPWVLWERKNRKSGGSRVTFYMAAGRSVYFFQSTAATAGAALEMHTILHDVWSVIFALIGPDSGTHTHTHTHTHTRMDEFFRSRICLFIFSLSAPFYPRCWMLVSFGLLPG